MYRVCLVYSCTLCSLPIRIKQRQPAFQKEREPIPLVPPGSRPSPRVVPWSRIRSWRGALREGPQWVRQVAAVLVQEFGFVTSLVVKACCLRARSPLSVCCAALHFVLGVFLVPSSGTLLRYYLTLRLRWSYARGPASGPERNARLP